MFIIDPRQRKTDSNTDSPPVPGNAVEQDLGERPEPVGADGGDSHASRECHPPPHTNPFCTPDKPLSEVLRNRLLRRLSPFKDYSVFDVLRPGPASRTRAAVQRTDTGGQERVERIVDTFDQRQTCSDPLALASSEQAKRQASNVLVAHGVWQPHCTPSDTVVGGYDSDPDTPQKVEQVLLAYGSRYGNREIAKKHLGFEESDLESSGDLTEDNQDFESDQETFDDNNAAQSSENVSQEVLKTTPTVSVHDYFKSIAIDQDYYSSLVVDWDKPYDNQEIDEYILGDPDITINPQLLFNKMTHAPGATGATQTLTDASLNKLSDTLDAMKTMLSARDINPEHTFKLEKFVVGKTDPVLWWDKLSDFCDLKGLDILRAFPIYTDDEANRWFRSLHDVTKDTIKNRFLDEFGIRAEKEWDRRKSLMELRQNSLPTTDFVRQVISKAYEVYNIESRSPMSDHQIKEVMSVLMNGFTPRVKTYMLLRNVDSIEKIIEAAREAKGVSDNQVSDVFVSAVVEDSLQNIVMPVMSKMQSSIDELKGGAASKISSPIPKPQSPPVSPKPTSPTFARGRAPKKVSFKDARTSPSPSRSKSPPKNIICHECGNPGHIRSQCALLKKGGQKLPGAKPKTGSQGFVSPQQSPQMQQTQFSYPPYQMPYPQYPAQYPPVFQTQKGLSQVKCFHCNQMGHMKRNCPVLRQQKAQNQQAANQPQPDMQITANPAYFLKLTDPPCQICQQIGHNNATTCPQRTPQQNQ